MASIAKEDIYRKYEKCNYVSSLIDTSVLILDDKYNFLYKDRDLGKVSDLLGNEHEKKSSFSTFTPLVWKLIITKDSIIIDRFYGQENINPKVFIPNEAFKVPL